MNKIKKIIEALKVKKTFHDEYSCKELPISLDEIISYIKENNLEQSFIDKNIIDYVDDIYLLLDPNKKKYKIVITERNFILEEIEYDDLLHAVREKIKNKMLNNLTKLQEACVNK